jgi:exopolyphosphatase/guanosine-5'-triphosphate,3'-diphosphate pyrophosphatase
MNKKKGGKSVAVIDIGSNLIKMRISQLQNNQIQDLDRLEYPVQLGHEVFNDGKISFESLKEVSSILRGYAQVMLEYGVSQYKVVATTVLREACNRAFVVDQLRILNNMSVEVLEDDQEKTLIYSEILRNFGSDDLVAVEDALISYIGTGSIGVALYNNGSMYFSQNIPMGSLKLHDMLSGIQEETNEFYMVLGEYIDGILGHLAMPRGREVFSNIILTGSEVELIAKLLDVPLKKGRFLIERTTMLEFYKNIRVMTAEKISALYHLNENQAEQLYTALAIYSRMLMLTNAQYVICPKIELWDAISRQLLFSKSKADYDEHVRSNALSCARAIAELYQCNLAHGETVRSCAALIFDKLKKLHGLSPKKKLLLEIAAILHEAGYYVSGKNHLNSTFDLIKNSNIYGLTDEEILLVANIARYDEFSFPNFNDIDYSKPSEKNKLLISKLAAIFLLANALDKSQKQKLKALKIRLQDEVLSITGSSDENVFLEKWAFDETASYFEEVFGVKPQLTVRPLLF